MREQAEEAETIKAGDGASMIITGEAGLQNFVTIVREQWRLFGSSFELHGGCGGTVVKEIDGKLVRLKGGTGGSLIFRPDPPKES